MEVVRSSETFVSLRRTKGPHVQEDRRIQVVQTVLLSVQRLTVHAPFQHFVTFRSSGIRCPITV